MLYEVFIPSLEEDGFDVTVRVEAENWTNALKTGLDRTGEAMVRNVMCDIKSDNTIHVTDATSRRVFVIREVDDDQQQEAAQQPPEASQSEPQQPQPSREVEEDEPEPTRQMDAVPGPEIAPEPEESSEPERPKQTTRTPEADQPPSPSRPAVDPEASLDEDSEALQEGDMEVGSSTFKALQAEEESRDDMRVVSEKRQPTSQQPAVDIGRQEEAEADQKVSESLIEDVFLEIQQIHEGERTVEEAVDIVMDMVMEKINAESGSVLFADVSGRELYFATARGPKADEVMDFRVPMGEGIVGFCAREGVSLAISDAQEDPRFYEDISEAIGYHTHSLACAPVQHEGRVYGAIEVINKQGDSTFSGQEISAMAYIGRQLAQFVNQKIMEREKIGG